VLLVALACTPLEVRFGAGEAASDTGAIAADTGADPTETADPVPGETGETGRGDSDTAQDTEDDRDSGGDDSGDDDSDDDADTGDDDDTGEARKPHHKP